METGKTSKGTIIIAVLDILIFAGFGLYTAIDSIVSLCRPDPEILNSILKIIFGGLFIATGTINATNTIRKGKR